MKFYVCEGCGNSSGDCSCDDPDDCSEVECDDCDGSGEAS